MGDELISKADQHAAARCDGLLALTFDFWGTLYQDSYAEDDRLRLLDDVLKDHGQRRRWNQLNAAYDHARSVWGEVWRHEQRSISIERWLEELLGYLDVELPDDVAARLGRAIEEAYLPAGEPHLVPGVSEILPRLAQRYPLGLISDTGLTPGRVLREVMRRDGLLSYFDVLTFSDELGVAKPKPEPFRRTLDRLGARPEEAAHIGDLPETDLVGARQVGMKAVLFLGVSDREDGRELADAVFEDYDELEHLLEQLG
jgi:putative hydrolase of the HAD superfamily